MHILTDLEKRLVNGAIRVLVRDGNKIASALEFQMVIQPNEMSLYLKTPAQSLFDTHAEWDKHSMKGKTGMINIAVNGIGDKQYLNPYLSWHGSGEIHANGYNKKSMTKSILIKKSKAISVNDLGAGIYLVATVVIALDIDSLALTTFPPSDFDGNYYEVSSSPYRMSTMNKGGRLHLVLDKNTLKPGAVVIDVFVHKRSDIQIDDLPYGPNLEYLYVDQPLTYSIKDGTQAEKFTLFMYQPVKGANFDTEIKPISFYGRSIDSSENIVFQATKLDTKPQQSKNSQ